MEKASQSHRESKKGQQGSFFSHGDKTATPFFDGPESTSGKFIQAKLTINQPGDSYEQEADQVAEKVMGESPAKNPIKASPAPAVSRNRDENKELQRKEEGRQPEASEKLERYVGGLSGSGDPLPLDLKNRFEPRFGHDFSGVRVHKDSTATESARGVNAAAYTHGSNIVFGEGQYQPGTDSGKKLIAHELTHVVQQGNGTVRRMIQRTTAVQALSKIEDAASGWGTDEDGIFNAIRECTERVALNNNPRVREILDDELSGYDLFKANLLLKYGTESNFPPGILLIWEATEGAGTDEDKVYDAIRSSTDRTRLQNDSWVRSTLRDELSGFDYAKAQLLFKYGTESGFPAYISPLWRATEPLGTDEDLLFNTLISLSPTDLTELKTNTEFVALLRDEVSGSDLDRLNAILDGKGPQLSKEHQADSAYGTARTGPIAFQGAGDANAFSPNDITQGGLGDCFFLANLMALAQVNPARLQSLISGPLADGSYNVTLQVRAGNAFSPQVVNVTPVFAADTATSVDTYSHGADADATGNTELWVSLLEKAYAKLKGTYDDIDGGFANEAMETLNGQRSEMVSLSSLDDAELIKKITDALTANTPVVADTISQDDINDLSATDVAFATTNQIVGGHSYAVISITPTQITLRNPWGGATASPTLTLAQFKTYYERISTIIPPH